MGCLTNQVDPPDSPNFSLVLPIMVEVSHTDQVSAPWHLPEWFSHQGCEVRRASYGGEDNQAWSSEQIWGVDLHKAYVLRAVFFELGSHDSSLPTLASLVPSLGLSMQL